MGFQRLNSGEFFSNLRKLERALVLVKFRSLTLSNIILIFKFKTVGRNANCEIKKYLLIVRKQASNMSAVPPKCTPEEIEKKRIEAQKRLQATREQKELKRKQKIDSENRLKFPTHQADVIQKPQLSDEKKAAIEKNRLEAIEKAKANNLISKSLADDLITKKVSPGKATAPSKQAITHNRANPYLKPQNPVHIAVAQQAPTTSNQDPSPGKSLPPSKASLTSNRSSPYQKPEPKLTKRAIPVMCSLEVISIDRFAARTDTYSETVINEFKKMSTRSYSEFKLHVEILPIDLKLFRFQINSTAPGHSTFLNTSSF